MAKEQTIRTKAKDKLTANGWIVSIPNRQRFGATTTTLKDGDVFERDDDKDPKQHAGNDDYFTIFDGIAWKSDKMRLIQWTSTDNVSTRVNKINDFLTERDVQTPKGTTIEVWGYENGKGFTRQEVL